MWKLDGGFLDWTRRELKERAKQVLRTSYWKAFLVSLLLAILSGGVSSCSFNSNGGTSVKFPLTGDHNSWTDFYSSPVFIAVVVGAILLFIFLILVSVAFHVFVTAPFEVSVMQYFKQAASEDVNMNYLVFSFQKGKYMAIVKGMLWKSFLTLLWTLLLIIPGIVKAYAYGMVPFLLGDNPGIGTKRAVELSKQMTNGHKWNMFVLDLSFLGWYILGFLALGIGVLFVMPYDHSTKAELYKVLRQQALYDGLSSNKELNLPEV